MDRLVVAGMTVSFALLLSIMFEQSDASTEEDSLRSIDVQVGNKTYPLFYNVTNGASITNVTTPTNFVGALIISVNVPSDAVVSLTFPRELYDALSFTEHEAVVFVDEIHVDMEMFSQNSCSEVGLRFPVEAGSEEIEILYSDIPSMHTHSNPPRLEVAKHIDIERPEGLLKFSLMMVTDALECNVSFMQEEKKIHVDIEGRKGVADEGYFRLMLPHDLLGGNYTVLVDGKSVNFTEQTYYFPSYDNIFVQSAERDDFTPLQASDIVFSYPTDATSIDIIGTTVIPEFSTVSVLVAAVSIASVLVLSSRKLGWYR